MSGIKSQSEAPVFTESFSVSINIAHLFIVVGSPSDLKAPLSMKRLFLTSVLRGRCLNSDRFVMVYFLSSHAEESLSSFLNMIVTASENNNFCSAEIKVHVTPGQAQCDITSNN